jgi:hypothetical protein
MLMRAVEAAEAWADGKTPPRRNEFSEFLVCDRVAWRAAERTAKLVASLPDSTEKQIAIEYQTQTLRCIFKNPYRPASTEPRWRTAYLRELAVDIYEKRTFERLPEFASVLRSDGCDDEDVLAHCRSETPHVRGCWAVDLVLGKN